MVVIKSERIALSRKPFIFIFSNGWCQMYEIFLSFTFFMPSLNPFSPMFHHHKLGTKQECDHESWMKGLHQWRLEASIFIILDWKMWCFVMFRFKTINAMNRHWQIMHNEDWIFLEGFLVILCGVKQCCKSPNAKLTCKHFGKDFIMGSAICFVLLLEIIKLFPSYRLRT